MKITHTEIYRFDIATPPFTIATGTSHNAANIFIRIHTDSEIYGVGECAPIPFITGETQDSCFYHAQKIAAFLKNKNPLDLESRILDLNSVIAYNYTIKSAFDMALYDIAAKSSNLPLYKFLGGTKRKIETDITIGIDAPEKMAETAIEYKKSGVRTIKIKLGTKKQDDLERIKQIRKSVGEDLSLRVDANQGWDPETAMYLLKAMPEYKIQFCEQPMRYWNDDCLPDLRKGSSVPIMLDESVFTHYDAKEAIKNKACDYINIKFAKSGGIAEADKINKVSETAGIPCMLGCMSESRVAINAMLHFAVSRPNVQFYDLDTPFQHKVDPVNGGAHYDGYFLEPTDDPGIGVDVDNAYLKKCEKIMV